MGLLCIAGSAVAAVFSLGLLIRKGRTPVTALSAAIMGCVAVSLGAAAAGYWADPDSVPVPLLTPIALMGIAIHRLIALLARLPTERRRRMWPLFLLLLPAAAFDVLSRVRVPAVMGLLAPLLHLLVALTVLAPGVLGLVHVLRLHSPKAMSGLAWVVLLVCGSVVAALALGLTGLVIGQPRLYAAAQGFASAAAAAGVLAFFRWPDALDRFREETIRRRYARSLLADLDVEGLSRGMVEMVRVTGLYKSEGCSLEELSRRMGLSRHQVSELLNDRMGVSFPSFINGFRIEEARRLLESGPDMTVLEIALESGFGNKTSFNDAFRRVVGMSPTEYVKMRAAAFRSAPGPMHGQER